MREAAERALRENCGDDLKAHILGNAPCAMYKYGHGPKTREITNTNGAKVFMYKAFYESGNASAVEDATRDFRWLTWEPFAEALPESVTKCVETTVCDEL